jgi:hypothetical protein
MSLDLAAVLARAERAHREIADICEGRRRWTMRVPAQPDADSDLLLSASVADVEALAAVLARVDKLAETLDPALFYDRRDWETARTLIDQALGTWDPPPAGTVQPELERRVVATTETADPLTPQTWNRGDPEPGPEVTAVWDGDEDLWFRRDADQVWVLAAAVPEEVKPWSAVTGYGPLVDASAAVSHG